MEQNTYKPSQKTLKKYSQVLINFALNNGKGLKKDEVVYIVVPESAKELLREIRNTILESGGHFITEYVPDDMAKDFYDRASQKQIEFFPQKYMRGLVDQMDHLVYIMAETNKQELQEVSPKKIMDRAKAFKPYKDWRSEKENRGEYSWVLALYGTQDMAREANLSLKEYWDQIIKACYLDEKDPVKKWQEIGKEVKRLQKNLTNMKIEQVHVESDNIDLKLKIGADRKWLGGDGNNIPSFEVFTSPDWRGTTGKIYFNQPLYRHGNLINGIALEFKDGVVVKSSAENGEKLLKELIKVENGNKVGEFSLTDSRLSRISKFMAETLFDENMGAKNGNTHIALGSSFKQAYNGDVLKVSKDKWEKMGFNDSAVHTDIISTENRKVTATLADGSTKVIYKDGKFTI